MILLCIQRCEVSGSLRIRCPVVRACCAGEGVTGVNRKHVMMSGSETQPAKMTKKELRGFGPLANYADRATAASWRSSTNFCG
jgi:hypothetical protein